MNFHREQTEEKIVETFSIEEFLEAKRVGGHYTGGAVASKTIKTYRSLLVLAEHLVGKPLSAFTAKDVDRLLVKLDDYSKSARVTIVSAARQAFAWAIATGRHTGRNPFAHVGKPPREERLPYVVPMKAIDRLLAEIPKHAPRSSADKYDLVFRLLATSGLRISEALNLRKRDLDGDGVLVRGKGNKQRYVPVRPEIMERLRGYAAGKLATAYLFQSDSYRKGAAGEPMSQSIFSRVFKQSVIAAGLDPDKVTPHTLRHSFATHALRKTGRLEVVQDLLGHADPKTTRIYAKLTRDDLNDAYAGIWDLSKTNKK